LFITGFRQLNKDLSYVSGCNQNIIAGTSSFHATFAGRIILSSKDQRIKIIRHISRKFKKPRRITFFSTSFCQQGRLSTIPYIRILLLQYQIYEFDHIWVK